MATRFVIKTTNGVERRIRIGKHLAENAAYRQKHGLTLAPEIDSAPIVDTVEIVEPKTIVPVDENKIVPLIDTYEEEDSTIQEDVLLMTVEELQDKYMRDDWVSLGKEMGLKGNLSNTGEAKLITRIKNKLEE